MRLGWVLFLFCGSLAAQTPALVQFTKCPGSGASQQNSTHLYTCPLPNPSLAGNIWLIGVQGDNTGSPTWAATDENADTGTLINSSTDGNGNFFGIFRISPTTGSRVVKVTTTVETGGFLTVSVAEFMNIGATDVSHCNHVTTNGTSITAGSMTPTVTGDLIFQYAGNATSSQLTTFFTVGSQSNITWKLINTDTFSGDGAQWGVYNSTTAINTTFTGQSLKWDSCAVAIKAASAGTAPSASPRIYGSLHAQGGGNTSISHEFTASGNNDLIVIAYASGGQTVTVTSTPSNTWSSAFASTANPDYAQVQYSCNASTAANMTIGLAFSAASDSTAMIYEVIGAATSSCLDAASAGQNGNQATIVTSLTTCSACVSTTTNNAMAFSASQWDFCTATGSSAPASSLFDAAYYTDNNLDGPQSVDQNGGWWHKVIASSSTSLTTTWTMSCAATAEGHWSGGIAAFKAATGAAQLVAQPFIIHP